jgi:hypothetical protein
MLDVVSGHTVEQRVVLRALDVLLLRAERRGSQKGQTECPQNSEAGLFHICSSPWIRFPANTNEKGLSIHTDEKAFFNEPGVTDPRYPSPGKKANDGPATPPIFFDRVFPHLRLLSKAKSWSE